MITLDERFKRALVATAQRRDYRMVIGGRPIRTALVWTEVPDLMELPAAKLDEAAARITSG